MCNVKSLNHSTNLSTGAIPKFMSSWPINTPTYSPYTIHLGNANRPSCYCRACIPEHITALKVCNMLQEMT